MPARWVRRRFNKGTMASAIYQSSCPRSHSSCPQPKASLFSLPCNSCCFLSCCLSSGAQSKRVCTIPLRHKVLDLQKSSISLNHNQYWFSLPDVLETPLPRTGTLGWRACCGTRIPWSSKGYLPPRYPSHFWTTTLWVWDLLVLPLCISCLLVSSSLYP